jgi:hypothetical protein
MKGAARWIRYLRLMNMSMTLHLDDVLAEELRREASVECIPPEELARRLVQDALEQRSAQRRWQEQNRRRLELIAKKKQSPLTAEEHTELARLQEIAYEQAVPFDRQLRHTVEELTRELQSLPAESMP